MNNLKPKLLEIFDADQIKYSDLIYFNDLRIMSISATGNFDLSLTEELFDKMYKGSFTIRLNRNALGGLFHIPGAISLIGTLKNFVLNMTKDYGELLE